jgi:PTH1 family peptidyl-tRNA hydrolase
VGFAVVDVLARRWGAPRWSSRVRGLFAAARRDGLPEPLLLLKPLTYMNLSGRAVQAAMAFYRVTPDLVFVVHDDMDVQFGTVRLKEGGGTAGHRGLESIVGTIGGAFLRLRVGIGRPGLPGAVDHVLSPFTAEESADLERVVGLAADAVETALGRGTAAAMNAFHRRRPRKDEG